MRSAFFINVIPAPLWQAILFKIKLTSLPSLLRNFNWFFLYYLLSCSEAYVWCWWSCVRGFDVIWSGMGFFVPWAFHYCLCLLWLKADLMYLAQPKKSSRKWTCFQKWLLAQKLNLFSFSAVIQTKGSFMQLFWPK